MTPTPLPTTAGQNTLEIGGAYTGPDRYTDHAETGEDRLLMVRWQDNKTGKWSKTWELPLGPTGSTYVTRWRCPMGIYRARQYEFTLADAVGFVLVEIEEELEVLK